MPKRKLSMTRKKMHILQISTGWILSLIVIIPFLIVLFNSVKTENESINMLLTPPVAVHLENFVTVWKIGSILKSYRNSLFVSVTPTLITMLSASMCSYVLVRKQTGINKFYYKLFAMGLMFPVSMVSVVKVSKMFGLYNSLPGLILVFSSLILPLTVFLYYGFIRAIPKEMDEAGIMDGANALQVFFRILFPMMKPVTSTVILLNFLNCWNDFMVPLYLLPDPDRSVILQQVYNFYGTFTASWNLVSVTIIYAVLPVVVVYFLGQKYIISGMTAGAIKG